MNDLRGYSSDDDSMIRGFGGWLAFFGLSIVASALLSLSNIITNYIPVFKDNTLSLMYKSNKTFFSIMLFEIITGVLLFGLLIFLCIIFLKKSQKFPNLMIYYMVLNCLIVIVDFILYLIFISPYVNIQPPNFITPIIYCLAWGLYLKRSKRVRNTFVA